MQARVHPDIDKLAEEVDRDRLDDAGVDLRIRWLIRRGASKPQRASKTCKTAKSSINVLEDA